MSEPRPAPRALVTGAGRRLGREICLELARQGYGVWVHYRSSEDEANSLVQECRSLGGFAESVCADLRRLPQIDAMFDRVVQEGGGLDLLVNNASTFFPTPMGEVSEEAFDDLVGTNFKAPFFCSQRAAPLLREARGQIVHLVDASWPRPWKGFLPYCAAKAALRSLTAGMAIELAPEVRVNAVAPGPALLPEHLGEAEREAARKLTLLGRTGSPEAVARTVAFLATGPDWITGSVVAVDGGRSLA